VWAGFFALVAAVFLGPALPWVLFPFHRTRGVVSAAACGGLAVVWFLVWDDWDPFAALTAFSALVRIVVEASGTFEEGRAKRREGEQADRVRRRNREASS
jgi:hypothetical protein